MTVTLALIAAGPAKVPLPTLMMSPLPAQASAPATVANGLVLDASAHAGLLCADADTYQVTPVVIAGNAVAACAAGGNEGERAAGSGQDHDQGTNDPP